MELSELKVGDIIRYSIEPFTFTNHWYRNILLEVTHISKDVIIVIPVDSDENKMLLSKTTLSEREQKYVIQVKLEIHLTKGDIKNYYLINKLICYPDE